MLVLLLLWQISAPSCADAVECRRLATEAAARGEAEAFHDLAWRAVQKGKRNDPELMLLLARAQSLSGRPGDAIVMLTRLVDLGVKPDIAADPDFARVRDLAGWPDLEAKLAGTPAPDPKPAASAAPAAAPKPAASKPSPAAPSTPPASAPSASAAATPPAPAPSAPAAATSTASPGALSFNAPGIEPFALGHDAVSRRFVLGDRRAHRLLIVDEMSRNVVNYVGASAGFLAELTGFAIDARRGDLWVVSAQGDSNAAESVLHKLQLVSGRQLLEARAAKNAGAVRFVGVAVAPDGTAYVLDAREPRLFRLRPGAKTLDVVMKVDARNPSAMAVADDGIVFVGDGTGLIRIDPAARTMARVKTGEDLSGFVSLAWRDGALLGIERVAGSHLVVRVALEGGGSRARARQILAASATPAVGALAADGFYYVDADQVIRRVAIK